MRFGFQETSIKPSSMNILVQPTPMHYGIISIQKVQKI